MPNFKPRMAEQKPFFQCTIVIPAYNEADRIVQTLDHILVYACEKQWSVEIIVVDDGSTDATAEIVTNYAIYNPSIRLIRNPVHRGKGHCVRMGVMDATGHVVLITDADLPACMEETSMLFQKLSEGADIVIGSRWLKPGLQQIRQSFLRRGLGRCFNLLVRLLLGLRFRDTQCGFKAFTNQAANLTFRFQTVSGWAFDAELLVIAKGLRMVVKEVPVRIQHDRRSKLKPFLHGFEMLSEVVRIAWYELLGKYPSPAAPFIVQQSDGVRGKNLWSYLIPTPARVAFAVLILLGTSMFMNGITAVIGSNGSREQLSSVVLQRFQPAQDLHSDFQNPAQDPEQNAAADEFDYVSDQD
jgi:dolichyl-phosphate beta-glucosyltransferase